MKALTTKRLPRPSRKTQKKSSLLKDLLWVWVIEAVVLIPVALYIA